MDKMVLHKYGEFKPEQTDYYQNKLRKKIFWLVLYTDKNTKDDFENIDVVKYHENLLLEISSYNELLLYPKDFVEIINTLESALVILKSDEFDFNRYKKLVFDAGALMQRLKVGD
jgi:hypothetical protein